MVAVTAMPYAPARLVELLKASTRPRQATIMALFTPGR